MQPVLIAGKWRDANSSGSFRAENPATREALDEFPISTWAIATKPSKPPRSRSISAGSTTGHLKNVTMFHNFPVSWKLSPRESKPTKRPSSKWPTASRECPLRRVWPTTSSPHDQPTSSGRRRCPRRAWALPTIDKAKYPLDVRPARPDHRLRPDNFPLAFNSVAAAISPRRLPRATRSSPGQHLHPGTTLLLTKKLKPPLKKPAYRPAGFN